MENVVHITVSGEEINSVIGKEQWAHLSPFCRSATAFGLFILCRAHSTVAIPVAAWFRFGLEDERLTASCREQLLFCISLSELAERI